MKAISGGARAARAATRKDVLPSSMGMGTGWSPLGGFQQVGQSPMRAVKAINTFGGTDEASSTVFSCVTLIADTLASYEYGITDAEGELLDVTPADEPLHNLLEEPWPEATYTDFAGDATVDMELVGNSYWLKDEMNALGQPFALKRMLPGNVRIVTNSRDEKIGYTYRVKGVEIPFDISEVIHFKLRNPLNPHYGMGTVEAVIREVQSDLTQKAHITAFFTNGARIAGVLTIPEGLDEVQFERLKDEIRSEYGSPQNAYKMLIAERSTDFKPITTDPKTAGVVELTDLAKNSILQGFGVPEFLLGGKMQGGVYKMSEAQFIFYRRMLPRAQRFQDRTSLSLASAWEGRKFILFPELNEPQDQKVLNAKGLAEACASPNEVRVAAGLPEIDDERMDMPLLPGAASPLALVFQQGQQPDAPSTRAVPHHGELPKAPRRIRPRRGKTVGGLKLPPGLPPRAVGDARVAQALTAAVLQGTEGIVASAARLTASASGGALTAGQAAPIIVEPHVLSPDEEAQRIGRLLAAAREAPQLPAGAGDDDELKFMLEPPELPHGYEQRAELIDPGAADVAIAQQILAGQADFFYRATPRMYSTFVTFFNDQRMRVLGRLDEHRSACAANNLTPSQTRKALERDSLWDSHIEDEFIKAAYLAIIDELGPHALEVPRRVVSVSMTWDPEDEHVGPARRALGELIVRINETTRTAIGEIVEEGVRRGYSIPRIANGYTDEGYKGIQGVFNDASAARAETIARSETAMLFNRTASAAYRAGGYGRVQIYDGTGDDICAEANGAIWTVDEFNDDPIGHPNCVRAGAPVAEGGI